jgi:hypothetical protein
MGAHRSKDVGVIAVAKQEKIHRVKGEQGLPMKRSTILLLPLLGAVALLVAACHKSKPAAGNATPTAQQKRAARDAKAPEATQRHWTQLNRLRQSDAFNTVISRTLLDDQGQLGFVLYSRVTPDKVSPLVLQLMAEMAKEFPNEDMTLSVYGAGSPPHKIGTAYVDGKTSEATYTPL